MWVYCSHTVVDLLNDGLEVVIVDNLVNSKRDVLEKIKKITGKCVTFYEYDLCDMEKLDSIFEKESISAG